mmetsp:Transcript_5982/g.5142  ORF Transcript_5982/g.5142 Transcript_5982/m.5142 type:complete len:346 (-) Transcript_5982:59-1096(-)
MENSTSVTSGISPQAVSKEDNQHNETKGRGVIAQPPVEQLANELDQKLNIHESDPIVKEELTTTSTEESTGINFSTTKQEFKEPVIEDEKKEDVSSTPAEGTIYSGTPSAVKKDTNKSKYFKSIDPEEMTALMTQLQEDDPEEFKTIMITGRELIKCADENDVAGFHTRMLECSNTNLLFWHTSKGFKKALNNFHKEMIDYMLNTLQVDMGHEVFKYTLHFLINRCISFVDDLPQQRYASELLVLLLNARRGIVNVDEIDPTHGSITAFQMTCFYGLHDMANKILVENCDVNAVDNCGKTPLNLLRLRTIKAKLEGKTELAEKLGELIKTMEERGAVLDWKNAKK